MSSDTKSFPTNRESGGPPRNRWSCLPETCNAGEIGSDGMLRRDQAETQGIRCKF
jgi:hypothetical protein